MYVYVLMRAEPRFLSQLTTRTSVRIAKERRALVWKGSRLVDFGVLFLNVLRVWRRKELRRSWMSLGMSQDFGHHLDSTCSFGLNSSSVCSGLPAK